jgi:hypothetical protein
MDKKPFLDRSLLIPIGIGVFSMVGILIVMLAVYLEEPPTAIPVDPTVTPFKYILLATETLVPDPELETVPSEETISEEPTNPISPILPVTSEATFPALPTTAPSRIPILATNTVQASISTPAIVTATFTGTAPATTTSSLTQKYDETDEFLEYDGDWVSRTGVGNAYQGTLSVSNQVGSDVIFSFEGQQIVIGYLGEPGLGSLTISIDDDEFLLNQSAGNKWVSPQFPAGEHFVILIHEDGDTINLDYVEIIRSN